MSAGTTPVTAEPSPSAELQDVPPVRRRRGRRWWLIVAVMVVAATAVVVVRAVVYRAGDTDRSGDNGSATSLATVERRSLSRRTQVNGLLGFAGGYTVLGQAQGTVTWLPEVGQVIGDGQVLYRVDATPVVLLYGSTPAWRALASGTTGADVAQLNHDLVALGYLRSADVDSAWDRFTAATRTGVRQLQKHLGVAQSGSLPAGDVVFLPSDARVTTLRASLGGPASGPVLQATSTTPTVQVALNTDLRSDVKAGDQVTITLPDGRTTPGTVTSVGTVATVPSQDSGGQEGATPTVPVTIQPTDPAATGNLDQAPVLVAITTTTVQDALAVPVYALLALAGGGYGVEVVDPAGTRHLVPVTPGLFDDASGLVQVTGSGLSEGLHVVVPAS
jgi:hypothetical protein